MKSGSRGGIGYSSGTVVRNIGALAACAEGWLWTCGTYCRTCALLKPHVAPLKRISCTSPASVV